MKTSPITILTGIFLALFVQVVIPQIVTAEQTIRLKDGTVLKGNLQAVEGDYYVINTANLGTINIHSEEIVSISAGNAGHTAPPSPGVQQASMGQNPMAAGLGALSGQGSMGMVNPGTVNMLAQGMMNDPQVQAGIQELMNDPELMSLMQDGSFMQLLMGMNSGQIENDPRFQKLMSNPQMRALMEMMSQKMPGPSGLINP